MAGADHSANHGAASPQSTPLAEADGKRLPLSAFGLLAEGDVFEAAHGKMPPDGPAKARAWVKSHLKLRPHGAAPALCARVEGDVVRQLSGNPQLSARLSAARPVEVELLPPGAAFFRYGYPRSVGANTNGLFWDDPSWPCARVALRQERLLELDHLVFHEFAHALAALAFTDEERQRLYQRFWVSYKSQSAIDEVFAIYSEREFLPHSSAQALEAPGVYGRTRQRWNEEHLFTRFVRNLYFPYKALAGPRATAGFL